VIFNMIMRNGSNLQELITGDCDLPKFSTFTYYKPGITNLKSLNIDVIKNHQNTIEFLSAVSKFCNSIVDCELSISANVTASLSLDVIKFQPLERLLINIHNQNFKKVIYALESRSETLKELNLKFKGRIDLSSITDLERFDVVFVSQPRETLFRKKFHLKELKLWHKESYSFDGFGINDIGPKSDVTKVMINSLCSEMLLKLSLNVITPETVKAIKESCPN